MKSITNISIDLDGYVTNKIWLYVVPRSAHQMVLGKKWFEDEDAVVHSREQRFMLRKQERCLYSVRRWRQSLEVIQEPKVASVSKILKFVKTIPVCNASLKDINKA